MKYIVFAGGAGTRLWPMSRVNSPKQFVPIKNGQSTLQMAIDRLRPFGIENVYISTNDKYQDIVRSQIEGLPKENIFTEPAKRDLAAAIGLTLMRLKQSGEAGPVAILWSDHLMEYPDRFREALTKAKGLVEENPKRFVFMGEKPRYANQNLGWICLGDNKNDNEYSFCGWKYRPELEQCHEMFNSGSYLWNTGYFVTDLDFVLDLYQKFMPEMYSALEKMVENPETIKDEYEKLESISFDNAIVEKVDNDQGLVMAVYLGWSDPGTLYAYKEAFTEKQEDNFEFGEVVNLDSKDCFVYNEEKGKLVATVGLEGMIVVNTPDATLVCKKEDVPRIKELIEKMKKNGKESYL